MTIKYFIISTLSILFNSIALIYSFSKISNKKIDVNIKNIIITLFTTILISINNFFSITIAKLFVSYILTFIREKIIFNENNKITFIIVSILTCISMLLEFILSPLAAFFIIDLENLNKLLLIKMIFSLINSIVFIIIISINKIRKFICKIKDIIDNFVGFYTISMLLICSINIFMYFFSYNLRNVGLLITIIICTIIVLVFVKIIIKDKQNVMMLEEKNKILKNEYKAYANTIDDCRELKHNLKNEFFSLKSVIPKEHQSIINSIISKYNKNYEWVNVLTDIPEGLQGLLYLKINEAKKKKVKILLNINKNLKNYNSNYMEISNCLGILIDNAIEASINAKKKNIIIDIEQKNFNIKIKIINNFNNKINIKEIGKKNYSTKEIKSGLGLHYLNKIKRNNIKVEYKIIKDLFIVTLEYKNKIS